MSELYQVFADHAEQVPEKLAVIEGDQTFTYSELYEKVTQVVKSILSIRVLESKPLRLLTVCESPSRNLILSLAVAKLEGTLIPANTQLAPNQIQNFIEAVEATLIVSDQSNLKQNGYGSDVFVLLYDELLLPPVELSQISLSVDDEHSFLVTLSSGSTGKPKPIVISQSVKLARAKQSIDLYQLGSSEIILNASPFFHSLGQRLSFVPIVLGATLIYLKRFSPKSWVALVEKYQVSFTIPVSTHLYALEPILEQNFKRLTSLNTLVTSSAPIDTEFKKQFQREVDCDLHEIYGATEVAIATNLSPQDFDEKGHTVGKPCDNIQIEILDVEHKPLKAGQIGEIAVKTPLMFSGYYKLPSLTESSIRNGYFLTGDLGVIDESGFLSYVSRQKDVIISGGINIYPPEIEACLREVPELEAVAVIGVDDALLGEVVLAICVGSASVEKALRQQANQQLGSYQRPLKYFFVESLPLTPSGKIDKMTLRAEYNAMGEDWSAPLIMLMYRE